jgi:hypothetical protein
MLIAYQQQQKELATTWKLPPKEKQVGNTNVRLRAETLYIKQSLYHTDKRARKQLFQ